MFSPSFLFILKDKHEIYQKLGEFDIKVDKFNSTKQKITGKINVVRKRGRYYGENEYIML